MRGGTTCVNRGTAADIVSKATDLLSESGRFAHVPQGRCEDPRRGLVLRGQPPIVGQGAPWFAAGVGPTPLKMNRWTRLPS